MYNLKVKTYHQEVGSLKVIEDVDCIDNSDCSIKESEFWKTALRQYGLDFGILFGRRFVLFHFLLQIISRNEHHIREFRRELRIKA